MRCTRISTLAAPALVGLVLAGCGSITVPVSGALTTGTSFAGQVTANLNGKGTFEAIGADGLYCSGTYDPFDRAETIVMPATCKDGRTATISATRNPDKVSGFGTITLSDGTTGTFKFGKGN